MRRRSDSFEIDAAWQAAVAATARAYGLKASILGATEGKGRQQRTPSAYWPARKVCIYVAVLAGNCTYADLARAIGMHRDTVGGYCHEMNAKAEADPMFARRMAVLEKFARARLIGVLQQAADEIDAMLAEALSLKCDRILTKKRRPTKRPTNLGGLFSDHENLIAHIGRLE